MYFTQGRGLQKSLFWHIFCEKTQKIHFVFGVFSFFDLDPPNWPGVKIGHLTNTTYTTYTNALTLFPHDGNKNQ